jgi:cyanophycinase-like exopeptidase
VALGAVAGPLTDDLNAAKRKQVELAHKLWPTGVDPSKVYSTLNFKECELLILHLRKKLPSEDTADGGASAAPAAMSAMQIAESAAHGAPAEELQDLSEPGE